jgi:hypothetical protein
MTDTNLIARRHLSDPGYVFGIDVWQFGVEIDRLEYGKPINKLFDSGRPGSFGKPINQLFVSNRQNDPRQVIILSVHWAVLSKSIA